MAVSKRLRFEILRRDNHACRYCGATAPEAALTVDHVVPVTLGGTDDPKNLVAACRDCNSGKSSVPADAVIVADVAEDALRWARVMQMVADHRAQVRVESRRRYDAFTNEWNLWTDSSGNTCPLPSTWKVSFDQFLNAGLEFDDMIELIDVAMSSPAKDTWRYFCGCCWTRVRDAQSKAAQIIAISDHFDATVGRAVDSRVTNG